MLFVLFEFAFAEQSAKSPEDAFAFTGLAGRLEFVEFPFELAFVHVAHAVPPCAMKVTRRHGGRLGPDCAERKSRLQGNAFVVARRCVTHPRDASPTRQSLLFRFD
jgi:hypothetical protein